MSLTYSNMMELGTKAPEFTLTDTVSGERFSFNSLTSSSPTVVMFICNHCPYVQHILPKLIDLVKYYQSKNVQFIAISSNDVEQYPADGPEKMKQLALTADFSFPYLYDEFQEVAKAYQAACTPDFYIFDKQLSCVYRGRFDDSSPGNNKIVTGQDLAISLDLLLEDKKIPSDQKPSMGCNIKWKKN